MGEQGGFALFASYKSTGIKTHRENKEVCSALHQWGTLKLSACEQCLNTIDVNDGTECFMTRTEGCQSMKYIEAEGLKTDLSCQLTWGLTMYNKLENMECGGEAMVGPSGETETMRNTAEDCAQLCYHANAAYHEYNIGTFGAELGNAQYCEAFEYNPNSRVCRMLTSIKPLWANCQTCIGTALSHNKLLGDMTCDNLYAKRKRVCQYDEADIECGKGQTIRVLEASYGRFDVGPCSNPSVPPTNVDDMCGEPNNVQVALKTACNGRQMCAIMADDQTLGDQGCGHVYKYAEVRYQCVES